MRVYKFMEAKWALEALKHRRLKISNLSTLNDPWELSPINFGENESMRAFWQKLVGVVSQQKGVLCFSSAWNDPVIWSHYGDNHRGIALGFDIAEHDSSGQDLLLEVEYTDNLLSFPADLNLRETQRVEDLKHHEEFLLKSYATKFSGWSYEKEVRAFVGLDDPDLATNHFFVEFGNHLRLREIIFGLRHNDYEQVTLVNSMARKLEGVTSWKAARGNERFELVRDRNWVSALWRPMESKSSTDAP